MSSERSFDFVPEEDSPFKGVAKLRLLSYTEKVKLRTDLRLFEMAKPAARESMDEGETLMRMYEYCAPLVLSVDLKMNALEIKSLEELLEYAEGEALFSAMVVALARGKTLPKT